MHLGQGFILTNWSESTSFRIFQFVLGVVCFIGQFTPWQKTSEYINSTYGCNILGQQHSLKAQYASSSKNVIWPGAEMIFFSCCSDCRNTHSFKSTAVSWEISPSPKWTFIFEKQAWLFLLLFPWPGGCRRLKTKTWWGCAGQAAQPQLPCPRWSPGDSLGPVSVPLRLPRCH